MDIIKPDQDGKPPWSPTVVNVMRGRAKKRKRSMVVLIMALLALSFGCIICGTQINKPKAAHTSKILPTPTITQEIITATIRIKPSWTPVPGNPLVGYRIEALKKP
jgi:hypothetical protein